MGGFILAKRENGADSKNDSALLNDALAVFSKKGLALNKKLVTRDFVIYVYHKYKFKIENVVNFDNDQFIISTGTLIYKEKSGGDALRNLFHDFSENGEFFKNTYGQYCLIIFKQGKLYLFNDALGVYPLYLNKPANIISSSFLATLKTLKKKTIAHQELYEYLINETFYGYKTMVAEIDQIDSRHILQLSPEPALIPRKPQNTRLNRNSSFDEMVKEVSNNLIEYFKIVKTAFDNEICAALSSGLDTRLMLALMRKVGIKPELYVHGKKDSSDVRVSEAITKGEGLELKVENPDDYPRNDERDFRKLVEMNYYWLDGLGEEYGAFLTGFDMDTYFKRLERARLHIQGSGGEAFRNRLMLPDKSYDILSVIRAHYDKYSSSLFTDIFNKKEYLSALVNKSKFLFDNKCKNIDRQSIEMIYNFFHLKHHIANIAKINNQFSYSLYPFTEMSITSQSLDIPIRYKDYGVFEAALINYIDPALAQYYSIQYGYKYSEYKNIPFTKKLRYLARIHSPIILRPIIRRNYWKRDQFGRDKFPYYLESRYLKQVFPNDDLTISRYINIDKITKYTMMSRALSAELVMNDML
ncbi:MAG TPA: hypothetical protein G4O16_05540 [Dehalococcoidia bacterium]|nr:hypothetical protein [Dehalococcoidia bacterium]